MKKKKSYIFFSKIWNNLKQSSFFNKWNNLKKASIQLGVGRAKGGSYFVFLSVGGEWGGWRVGGGGEETSSRGEGQGRASKLDF